MQNTKGVLLFVRCWYIQNVYHLLADLFTCLVSVCVQIKILTELRMFSQAVQELNSLTFGEEIPLHHGGNRRGTGEPSRVQQHRQYTVKRIHAIICSADSMSACSCLLFHIRFPPNVFVVILKHTFLLTGKRQVYRRKASFASL